jgi:outer membrane protein
MIRRFPHVFLALALVPGLAWSAGEHDDSSEPRVLTLDLAYDLALATDQSIAIAYAEARKGALEPASALTRMFPTLNGNATSNRNDRTGAGRGFNSQLGNISVAGAQTNNNASLTFVQPFLDLTAIPAYRRGKLISESTRLQYKAAIRQTLYSVAQAFYDVLSQQRIVEVSVETLRLAGENLEVAQKRAAAGAVTRTDVLRASAAQEENRRALIQAQNELVVRRNVLGNLLDLKQRKFTVVEPPANSQAHHPGADGLDAILETAYSHREDLRAQELVIAQDEQRRKEIKAQYAPTVTGQASASTSEASGNRNSSDWQAVLAVRVPFIDAGTRAVDLRRAGIQVEQSRANYDQFRESVQEEVTNAFVLVRTLKETIEALQAQVEAEEQAYNDVQTQYQAGTARSLDVLDALRTLNNARKDLAVQTYGYQTALRRLEQVTGILQEERVARVAP